MTSILTFKILDIYIYREDSPVLQRRSGERLVEIRGKPDYSGIIDDIVGSRQGKIAILGKISAVHYGFLELTNKRVLIGV